MTSSRKLFAPLGVAVLLLLGACQGEARPEGADAAGVRDDSVKTRAEREAVAPLLDPGSARDVADSGGTTTRPRRATGAARNPGRGPKSPMESPWDAIYSLDGTMSVTTALGKRTFAAPAEMTSSYLRGSGSLIFFTQTDPRTRPRVGMGMILEMIDVEGSGFRRLSIITPHSEGGTVTYGFPLRRNVAWLGLGIGEEASATTTNRSYRLLVTRPSGTTWEVRIEPSGIEPPRPWFERGTFRLDASSATPPWDVVEIAFETFDGEATTTGRYLLTRR